MMKTRMITVNSNGNGMQDALDLTENVGLEMALTRKENLRLRLLAEELFGTMKSIAGNIEGSYFIEYEGKSFEINMVADIVMTAEMKEQFISVSSTGKNAAATSFMGKLRDMIGSVLLSMNTNPSMIQMGLMSMGSPGGYQIGETCYQWYMNGYRTAVDDRRGSDSEASEAWDELEKSIVANIADDIAISIVGSKVSIKISKAF